MGNDKLTFFDNKKQRKVIFNLYSFCEILKGCLNKFCGVPIKEANKSVENCRLFKPPITCAFDVYFFSHEHPYHWAMMCYYGGMYWEKNRDLLKIPENYDDWEKSYIETNNLKKEIFIFM